MGKRGGRGGDGGGVCDMEWWPWKKASVREGLVIYGMSMIPDTMGISEGFGLAKGVFMGLISHGREGGAAQVETQLCKNFKWIGMSNSRSAMCEMEGVLVVGQFRRSSAELMELVNVMVSENESNGIYQALPWRGSLV